MSVALRTVRIASSTLNAAQRPTFRSSCRCFVISSNNGSTDSATAHRRSYQHEQIRGMMSKGFQRVLKVAGVNGDSGYENDEPLMNRYSGGCLNLAFHASICITCTRRHWEAHLTLFACCAAHLHLNSEIKARRVLLVLPKEEGSDVQPPPQVVDTWTALQTAQLRKLDLVCGESLVTNVYSNLKSLMCEAESVRCLAADETCRGCDCMP
jgi:hypothetical protein